MAYRYIALRQLRNAFGLMLVLCLMPAMFGRASVDLILQGVIWAGIFCAPYTWWELRKNGVWPLFDNLRVIRTSSLAAVPVILVTLGFLLRWAL